MGAAITELRQAVKSAIALEFSAEIASADIADDKMHESLGWERACAAVYPMRERPLEDGAHGMMVAAQVFNRYDLQIDPAQRVDPATIEGWAWRLQRRFLTAAHVNTNKVAWFNVADIVYPPDPTDNITRFVMTLEAFGDEPTLMETSP